MENKIFDFTGEDFDFESLPEEVREVLNRYCEMDNTYDVLNMIHADLFVIGYELDYELTGEIMSISKINSYL